MSKLYLECYSGISGDMFVASMLDLGASQKVLEEVLASLPLDGYKTGITRVNKSGLDVCDFNVVLEHDNHDHDMDYLYGEHHHEHHHHHEHRHLHDILHIIDHGEMTEGAKDLAKKIFTILGEAEAKAHGTSIEEVHFHEVGAVDSIVDIISAAVCFDDLGIDEVYIPVIYEGTGTVNCAHGTLPIPVPAVNNIVSSHHLPLHIDTIKGELVTPTGAAIASAIVTDTVLPETFTIKKTGVGAGKRAYERPSLLRAMLIETTPRH
ncbi:LarC family nickel insertion protein [uncultured Catenibacterium sp.]|uniref:LarC family nickel insertion protein n=1 Tax=uncultured Catenibacterium sp. TaxID=286142 RepID=UPI0025D6848A|nr:LarC family nickel insertion protein [uncultured Catenibacterium sp.]